MCIETAKLDKKKDTPYYKGTRIGDLCVSISKQYYESMPSSTALRLQCEWMRSGLELTAFLVSSYHCCMYTKGIRLPAVRVLGNRVSLWLRDAEYSACAASASALCTSPRQDMPLNSKGQKCRMLHLYSTRGDCSDFILQKRTALL
jgi:hypothetical protein